MAHSARAAWAAATIPAHLRRKSPRFSPPEAAAAGHRVDDEEDDNDDERFGSSGDDEDDDDGGGGGGGIWQRWRRESQGGSLEAVYYIIS